MTIELQCIAVDAIDPQAQGRWWAEALGWGLWDEEPDEVCVSPPSGSGQTEILFLKVPEDKQVKNRIHLDLRPDDQEAEVARFEALGATRVDVGQQGNPEVTWVVLADPEGNEFCILRALRPDEKG
jgi:predicted enzyme related to lactoylglutathione lyase